MMLAILEYFNETMILLSACLIVGLSDIIDDPQFKYDLGWALMAVTAIVFVVNLLTILAFMLAMLYNKIKTAI